MNNEHKDNTFLCGLEEGDVLPSQLKVKMVRKEKQLEDIVESFHLSTMVANYHWHFGIYSIDKK
jgi:hypothetical protein